MGLCDFCGEERELVKFGKAKVCIFCRANQIKKPAGKEVKASTAEFTKAMSGRTHADYMRKDKKSFKLGPIE